MYKPYFLAIDLPFLDLFPGLPTAGPCRAAQAASAEMLASAMASAGMPPEEIHQVIPMDFECYGNFDI